MDRFLHPIIVAFAWIWVNLHKGLVFLGVPDGPGFGWVLSIILMTVLVRLAILPLYLKQIRSMRSMQVLQPEIKKLQDKYKGRKDAASRQAQQEEMMALYKEHGSSPFASCLPMMVQLPVLFALYRVIFAVEQIKDGTYSYPALGPLNQTVAVDIDASTVFGVGLSQSIGTSPLPTHKAVFIVFIIVMVALQFLTMRLTMTKNMAPQTDPNNPMVRSQKSMMYLMPAMFIMTGLIFKMALLVYMVTTTTVGYLQQLWVVKAMPTPGSPAYLELMEKREAHYKKWAAPVFEQMDADMRALDGDEEGIVALQTATWEQIEKQGRKQKINTDFPEDWSAEDRLAAYRPLAFEEWKSVPDELWMNQLVNQKKSQKARAEAQKARPRNLSRAQRQRVAERERREKEAEAKREARRAKRDAQRAKQGGNLTDEEIARRRQERKAERRQQAKNKQQKKDQGNQ